MNVATVERVFTLFGSMHVVPAVGGESGGLLPDLRNPATDLDIRLGMEAIDENGGVLVGAMPEKEAASYVPSLSEQHIPSGQFLKGEQTIRPVTGTLLAQLDPEFIPSNIRKGTDLFGVAGAYEETPVIEPLSITENGTYAAPSGVDGYSPVTVNVAASEGLEFPERQVYCTLASDMTWKEIMEANPITPRYEKSLIWFLHVGDNASATGSATYKWMYIYLDKTMSDKDNLNRFISYSYVNGLVSPNSMGMLGTIGGVAGSYVTVQNGTITSVNRGVCFGAGNTIFMQEIPFDILNCRFDFTEWEAN